jgi:hypothetical protein
LIGVIETGLELEELRIQIAVSPGADHGEFKRLIYCALDPDDEKTTELLSSRTNWVAGGLASFMSAINYYRARSRRK